MQYFVHRKKIIKNILSTMFIFFICFLFALSLYTYYATRTVIINSISGQNSSLSALADTFTQQYYKMVRNYGINVFYSRNITKLRNGVDLSNKEYIEGMRELYTYASSTDYIHSIYIYNQNEDYIYCNLDSDLNKGSSKSAGFFDTEAVSMLKNAVVTAPVPRRLDINSKDSSVISFLFYDMADSEVKSSMMLNVSLNWLQEFLSSILGLGNTSLYLSTGEAIIEHPNAVELFSDNREVFDKLLDESCNGSCLIHRFAGKRYICFCEYNKLLNWYFVRVEDYGDCLKAALSMRRTLIVITGIIALIAAFFGACLFRKLFNPVDKLLETFSKDSISNSISTVGEALSYASDELRSRSEIIKMEFLKRLLLFSSKDCSEQILKEKKIQLNEHDAVHIMLVEPLKGIYEINSVMNDSVCEIVPIGGNYVIISQDDSKTFLERVDILGHHARFCAFSIGSSVCDLHETYSLLDDVYRLRFFLPQKEIYTPEILQGRTETPYPHRLEARITSALMQGNGERAMQLFSEFAVSQCQNSTYACLHSHFKQLYLQVCELKGNADIDITEELDEYENAIRASHTLDELMGIFRRVFFDVAEINMKAIEQNEAELIARVKKDIGDRYYDTNLSSMFIADLEGVSNGYLCELFKRYEDNTIPKYVTSYRLERSCELLRTTDMSVTSVAKAVGFTSSQYFGTVFKTYYNMTPAKYREQYL